MFDSPVEVVGWLTIVTLSLKLLFDLSYLVFTTFLARAFCLNLRKCGPWAVVTGATDGIGKAYVKQFAAAGLNVVLISRTPSKLSAVAEEIKSQFKSIEVKTIAADFTESQSIYPKLKAELDQLEIGILVNNVGMLIGFRPLAEFEDDKAIHDMIICNTMSVSQMTHIVLPQMMRRRRGVILNLSSLSSAIPTPFLTVYGATKAYVDKFSQDLCAECKGTGVYVQTVAPGFVGTNMISHVSPSHFSPSADTVAITSLQSLGLEDRTAGFWLHKIQLYLFELINFYLPRKLLNLIVLKQMASISKQENKASMQLKNNDQHLVRV